jgi:hypothetical protein
MKQILYASILIFLPMMCFGQGAGEYSKSKFGLIGGYDYVEYKDTTTKFYMHSASLNGIEYIRFNPTGIYFTGNEYRTNELKYTNNSATYNYKYSEINYVLGVTLGAPGISLFKMAPQLIIGFRKNDFSFEDTSSSRSSELVKNDEETFIPIDQMVYGLGVPFEFHFGKIYTSVEIRKYLQEALVVKYFDEEATLTPFLQVNIKVGLKI